MVKPRNGANNSNARKRGYADATTEMRITQRRARVTELVLKGWSYGKIGQEVGVSAMQVCRDVREITEEWRQHYMDGIEAIKLKEARRIEQLLAAHWEEFEESKWRTIPAKVDPKTGKPMKGPEGKDRKVRVVGDREYLQGIQECVAMLWKLYGIGQDVPGNTTNQTLNVFSVDKLTETLKAVAVEQENSRLAEVERLQQDQAKIAAMTVSEGMTALEKLEAVRAQEKWEEEQATSQTESASNGVGDEA